ncbi:hypothetical protein Tco_1259915, partial [Tanacetum coccineum]
MDGGEEYVGDLQEAWQSGRYLHGQESTKEWIK